MSSKSIHYGGARNLSFKFTHGNFLPVMESILIDIRVTLASYIRWLYGGMNLCGYKADRKLRQESRQSCIIILMKKSSKGLETTVKK